MRALTVYATLLIAGSTAPVRIGDAAIQTAIEDPECGTRTARHRLDGTEVDSAWEGRSVAETADQWEAPPAEERVLLG